MNKSIPYKLSTTNDKFTSRSGLILPAEILRQMDGDNLAKRYFPAPGSNRGFSPGTYIRAFVLMGMAEGRCLEDIRHLQTELALLSMCWATGCAAWVSQGRGCEGWKPSTGIC